MFSCLEMRPDVYIDRIWGQFYLFTLNIHNFLAEIL